MSSLCMAFFFLLMNAGGSQPASPTTHVTIDAKSAVAMAPGSSGAITIMFHPKRGIHINADPAISVVPEHNQVITSVGSIVPSKNKNGYVDASKPVTATAAVSASAPKGAHTVKVKVVYYLCSDKEGWCNRDEQLVDLRVTVK